MTDLEELKPTEEVEVTTPEKEAETPTPPTEEPTLEKTYTQKDFDKAVGQGLSTLQGKLTLTKAEADKEKAARETLEKQLQEGEAERQREVEELASKLFADDPDSLARYRDTKAAERAREEARRDREKAEEAKTEADNLRWAVTMETEYQLAIRDYQVPFEAVEDCRTVESLWKIAKLFPKVEPESTKPAPKLASGVSTGGVDVDSLSARGKIALGYDQAKKQKQNRR